MLTGYFWVMILHIIFIFFLVFFCYLTEQVELLILGDTCISDTKGKEKKQINFDNHREEYWKKSNLRSLELKKSHDRDHDVVCINPM